MSVNSYLNSKAFTLIELIIVVVIMGVIYTMAVTNFDSLKTTSQTNLSLKKLKEYLSAFSFDRSAELICTDECSTCRVFIDTNSSIIKSPFSDILDSSIQTYKYDLSTGLQEKKIKVYFNTKNIQEDVCFSYKVDKHGVGDQVIVEFENKVYDFTSYLEPTAVYDSLEKLTQAREILTQEVMK